MAGITLEKIKQAAKMMNEAHVPEHGRWAPYFVYGHRKYRIFKKINWRLVEMGFDIRRVYRVQRKGGYLMLGPSI